MITVASYANAEDTHIAQGLLVNDADEAKARAVVKKSDL